MQKRIRIMVPAAQVLGFVTIFLLAKLSHSDTAYFNYYLPAKSIMTQLNFPLWALWIPVAYVFEHTNGSLPSLGGVAFGAVAVLAGIVFLSTVALFWYFVVREIEMRRSGRSFLRFSVWSKQLLMTVILFSFGIGATFAAYSEVKPLWYISTREAILRGLLLSIWTLILIGTSIHDLVILSRNKTSGATKEHLDPMSN